MFLSNNLPSDEGLIFRARMGDNISRDLLVKKYFAIQKTLIDSLGKNFKGILDQWDVNEVYFKAFIKAEESFLIGRGRFFSFFTIILSRELNHEILRALDKKRLVNVVAMTDLESDAYKTLEEGLYVDNDQEEVTKYLDRKETLETVKHMLFKGKFKGSRYFQLQESGYTHREIATLFNTSVGSVRYEVRKFVTWAKSSFNISQLQGVV